MVIMFITKQKMKQPKFMKYNDEKDDKKEMRNTWIHENNIQEIKVIFVKNIKSIYSR